MDSSPQKPSSNRVYIPLQEQTLSNTSDRNLYNQQRIQAPQQIIVNQQVYPQVLYIDSSKFRNSPILMSCPFCKSSISTHVKKNFNYLNCIICLWAGVCCWAGMQYCRNKELNCYDSEHYCPVCLNKIGDYSSC